MHSVYVTQHKHDKLVVDDRTDNNNNYLFYC